RVDDRIAEPDGSARAELGGVDSDAVDDGAVEAAEIANPRGGVAPNDLGMEARDGGVGDPDGGGLGTPEDRWLAQGGGVLALCIRPGQLDVVPQADLEGAHGAR